MIDAGKISIVVPVYNVEKYLKRCVESILQQDYENWELILIDDGSSDGTGVMCDQYSAHDSRIQVLHTENKGVSSARNTGKNLVKGDYILFVDSDDWLENDMLSRLVKAIIKNKSEIAICDVYYVTVDESGNENKVARNKWVRYKSECNINGKEIYRAFFINSGTLWNKLIKTEIVKNVNFDVTLRYGEDTDYLLKLMPKVDVVTVVPYCGYNYYINRVGNVVSSLDRRSMELMELGKKIYKELAAQNMGAIGVYRIFAVVTQTLQKIPNEDKYNKIYEQYYRAAKKALRVPAVRDIIRFLMDNRIEKKIRLEYCIKLLFPRHGNLT